MDLGLSFVSDGESRTPRAVSGSVNSDVLTGRGEWPKISNRSKAFRAFVRLALLHRHNRGIAIADADADVLYEARSYVGSRESAVRWANRIFESLETFKEIVNVGRKKTDGVPRYSLSLDLEPRRVRVWLDGEEVTSDDEIEKLARHFCSLPIPPRELKLCLVPCPILGYTQSIANGLHDRLDELGYKIDPQDRILRQAPRVPVFADAGRKVLTDSWQRMLRDTVELPADRGADFLIPLGTQASEALRSYLGDRFGADEGGLPVCFLGVTYPVASHLVDSLKSRFERRQIAGVAYGADGLRAVAGMIHNWLLPGCEMTFVYFNRHSQDCQAAEQLAKTRLHHEGKLRIEAADESSLADVMRYDDRIYFSWYTFEDIFESPDYDPGLRQLLENRRVIATTRKNCDAHLAMAAVAADDYEIGRTGAEILHGYLNGAIPHLGRHPIVIPEVKYWINEAVASARGVHFAPQVLAAASRSRPQVDYAAAP